MESSATSSDMSQMASDLEKWIKAQRLRGPDMKATSIFYRNLENALDARRSTHHLIELRNRKNLVDFLSNDVLSLSNSEVLRQLFMDEIAANPEFALGSTASRLMPSDSTYIETVEKEIAAHHRAETGLVLGSGYDGNAAIFCAIPRPGDVIVLDELVHASVHDGLKHSLAETQKVFRHNDVDSFEEVLVSLRESHPLIRSNSRCVLIAVESVYSMDGDVCPLKELVSIAKEIFPKGNAQFIIDEAHSTGMIGEDGRGLVCELGLEKEIAIRLHTFGKALGAMGACILSNETVRHMIINFARPFIYTTAPSFPVLAAIRAGYNMMRTGKTREPRSQVIQLIDLFFKTITSNAKWNKAVDAGICSIPLSEDWQTREFVTQFVPLWTRPRYNYYLTFHLQLAGMCTVPIDPPAVPRGTSRVRLVIHAANTEAQICKLANSICEWAQEMLEIEQDTSTGLKIPSAMRKVYALMAAFEVHQLNPTKIVDSPLVAD